MMYKVSHIIFVKIAMQYGFKNCLAKEYEIEGMYN